ncbi:MAG: hypothetical protein WBN63_04305, partial [Eudoraea sp.]|uniref:hypothetical protein n=1 Tax=Eudoraea sp. TaxID=1979955 RepID=UPI003C72C28A
VQSRGIKVQQSFHATAHWQVIGLSGRSSSGQAMTTVGWFPDIGQESWSNGRFLISSPAATRPLRTFAGVRSRFWQCPNSALRRPVANSRFMSKAADQLAWLLAGRNARYAFAIETFE